MTDRNLRYCPECHCWGVHHPACPEGDNAADLADEAYQDEEMDQQQDEETNYDHERDVRDCA